VCVLLLEGPVRARAGMQGMFAAHPLSFSLGAKIDAAAP
jgi:hypothetical protein